MSQQNIKKYIKKQKKTLIEKVLNIKIVKNILSSSIVNSINNSIKPYFKKILIIIILISLITGVPIIILYSLGFIMAIFMIKETMGINFIITIGALIGWYILLFVKIALITLKKEAISYIIYWFCAYLILTAILILLIIFAITGIIESNYFVYNHLSFFLLYDMLSIIPFFNLLDFFGVENQIVRFLLCQICNIFLISTIFILTLKNKQVFQKNLHFK